jgi:hypothetical protein
LKGSHEKSGITSKKIKKGLCAFTSKNLKDILFNYKFLETFKLDWEVLISTILSKGQTGMSIFDVDFKLVNNKVYVKEATSKTAILTMGDKIEDSENEIFSSEFHLDSLVHE